MIGYATVGSNNLPAAKVFYDKLMSLIGMKPMMDHPSGGRLYGSADGRMFGVFGPYDGKPATVGNGSMTGFALPNREKVRQFHKLVLELGGKCEGEPGPRGPEEFNAYFTYVRDLDGNKLCAYRIGPDAS